MSTPTLRRRLSLGVRGVQDDAFEGALRALEHLGQAIADPHDTFRAVVETIARIAHKCGGADVDARDRGRRHELVRRGTRVLSDVTRRGVEAGAFRPRCSAWAIHRLPHAIVAGVCAAWAFGLRETRAVRAKVAADAALEQLRPRQGLPAPLTAKTATEFVRPPQAPRGRGRVPTVEA